MFKYIKFNKGYWKKKFPFIKFGVPDPLLVFSDDEGSFSEAMTSFRFAQVYKTTKSDRHKQTQLFLKQQISLNPNPIILDIGASDGTTSLNFIELLNGSFKKYYVTDYNIECQYVSNNQFTYFFDLADSCFLIASKKFVVYPNDKWLFRMLFKNSVNGLKNKSKKRLLLTNKKLLKAQNADERIIIERYNIFEDWVKEKANIIIAGNLLNRSYFSEEEIKKGLTNCYNALSENGMLAVIRNELDGTHEIEKSNVYYKNINDRCFEKRFEINDGVEIDELILSLKF